VDPLNESESETENYASILSVAKEMLDKTGVTDRDLRKIIQMSEEREEHFTGSQRETARQFVYLAFCFEIMRGLFFTEARWTRFVKKYFPRRVDVSEILLAIAADFAYDKSFKVFLKEQHFSVPDARSLQGGVPVRDQLDALGKTPQGQDVIADYRDLLAYYLQKKQEQATADKERAKISESTTEPSSSTTTEGSASETDSGAAAPSADSSEQPASEDIHAEAAPPLSAEDLLRDEILQKLSAKVPALAIANFTREFITALKRCPDLIANGDKVKLGLIRSALLPAQIVIDQIPAA
jgi:hypothetical protein